MCVGEEIPHELELVPESIKSHLNNTITVNHDYQTTYIAFLYSRVLVIKIGSLGNCTVDHMTSISWQRRHSPTTL